MVLETGQYIIQNVRSQNFLSMPDSADRSPVVATGDAKDDSCKWNIIKLGNGKYTIENKAQGEYVGYGLTKQFDIKETRKKDQYTRGHLYDFPQEYNNSREQFDVYRSAQSLDFHPDQKLIILMSAMFKRKGRDWQSQDVCSIHETYTIDFAMIDVTSLWRHLLVSQVDSYGNWGRNNKVD
ncbi:hypothetical protein WOLCODRAFT_19493 [Wolfiporia cocos MD-104 SS10]|uniref:Ricin B lectin domain-containing protein n=1 Tax=Wolfiporia cocos (strain MD-104) TaxID=742152 RepID=A0A2H3J4F4_WOLCO|nr:hypothetical protein WOLCODRAFT_19493 [Wolfiporia cocos MD-104 SS10]